jgi:hypothetical protein
MRTFTVEAGAVPLQANIRRRRPVPRRIAPAAVLPAFIGQKSRARRRRLVAGRAEAVSGRHEVVRARFHGGPADGARPGGGPHPHRDDPSRAINTELPNYILRRPAHRAWRNWSR